MGEVPRKLVTAILNDARLLREYAPGRTPAQRLRRSQAILKLGLTVKEAFNNCDDYESLLVAVADGLRPRNDPPF